VGEADAGGELGGFVNCAIAPLDIAMWDAAAKTVNQPLYRLLGGSRDRVPAYAIS
jgi:L-alanine-DL-glutamate epimerase-like enolase superfamily enzyme